MAEVNISQSTIQISRFVLNWQTHKPAISHWSYILFLHGQSREKLFSGFMESWSFDKEGHEGLDIACKRSFLLLSEENQTCSTEKRYNIMFRFELMHISGEETCVHYLGISLWGRTKGPDWNAIVGKAHSHWCVACTYTHKNSLVGYFGTFWLINLRP